MEEVAAPLAGFARPDPAFGGKGHGVGNQFLLGDLKAAGSRQRQDLVWRLDLLELTADLAMLCDTNMWNAKTPMITTMPSARA